LDLSFYGINWLLLIKKDVDVSSWRSNNYSYD
jgi:hypothetical protein